MDKQTKTNLTNVDHWVRLIYMVIIGILLVVARTVVWVVALLQFFIILFTGDDNLNLRNLGQGVAKWCYQAFLFLTFNADKKPFPFDDWPELDPVEEQEQTAEEVPPVAEESPALDDVPSFTQQPQDLDEKPDEEKKA